MRAVFVAIRLLEIDHVQDKPFDDRRFDDVCVDAEQWFVRKHDRAFVHCPYVSRKAEAGEVIKKAPFEKRKRFQILYVFFGEAEIFYGFEEGAESRKNGKSPVERLAPEKTCRRPTGYSCSVSSNPVPLSIRKNL